MARARSACGEQTLEGSPESAARDKSTNRRCEMKLYITRLKRLQQARSVQMERWGGLHLRGFVRVMPVKDRYKM